LSAPPRAARVYGVGRNIPKRGAWVAYPLAGSPHLKFRFAVIALTVGRATPNLGKFA
jgi:hypothetical protein